MSQYDQTYFERGLIASTIIADADRANGHEAPDVIADVRGPALCEFFGNADLGDVWKLMCQLHQRGERLSIPNIVDAARSAELRFRDDTLKPEHVVDWINHLLDLSEFYPVSISKWFAAMVVEHGIRRQRGREARKFAEALHKDGRPVGDFYADHLRILSEPFTLNQDEIRMDSDMAGLVSDLERIADGKRPALVGVPTGLDDFDRLTGGLYPGQLVVVGARPGVGKSALALSIVRNITRTGTPAGFVTIEMTRRELQERLVAQEADVDALRLRKGPIAGNELGRITQAAQRISEWPIHLLENQTGWPTVSAEIQRMAAKKAEVVFVDYLQLLTMPGTDAPRWEWMGQITAEAKRLAMSLGIAIVLMAQLNREVERGPKREPRLSDLRDTGAIEQDANVVLLLHRPDPFNEEGKGAEAHVIVAKNRSGPLGRLRLTFLADRTQFTNAARDVDWSAQEGATGPGWDA